MDIKIAVIDPHDNHRELMADGLSARLSCEVLSFNCSDEFIQACVQPYTPDVLVVDLDRRSHEGLDFCIRIKEAIPGLILIGISATLHTEFRANAVIAGVDKLFLKPVLMSEMTAAIRRAVIRRES